MRGAGGGAGAQGGGGARKPQARSFKCTTSKRGNSKDAGSVRGVPADAEGVSTIDKATKHRLQLKSKAPIRLVETRTLQKLESASV